MAKKVLYMVVAINFWSDVRSKEDPSIGIGFTSGSVGFAEIFDDYDKALEAADGDASLIATIGAGPVKQRQDN